MKYELWFCYFLVPRYLLKCVKVTTLHFCDLGRIMPVSGDRVSVTDTVMVNLIYSHFKNCLLCLVFASNGSLLAPAKFGLSHLSRMLKDTSRTDSGQVEPIFLRFVFTYNNMSRIDLQINSVCQVGLRNFLQGDR